MKSSVQNGNGLYRFDDVTVDLDDFTVRKGDRDADLKPRAFDALAYLVKNAGRVVTKQELFEQVWKETFVSDNALTKTIKEIRHELGDSADNPLYIETITKRGYRFIGRLTNSNEPNVSGEKGGVIDAAATPPEQPAVQMPPEAPVRATFSRSILFVLLTAGLAVASLLVAWSLLRRDAPADLSDGRTIAVLPFKPLVAENRDESLEMGMAETLITRLSGLKQLTVRPMSAVRKYTGLQQDPVEAGRESKADSVLDGSIQKTGDRIRVTVRLIDVDTGNTQWSSNFDEDVTDIFKVQDSIAERVVNALRLRLSSNERQQIAKHYTDDPAAYDLYLRGKYLWHRRIGNWAESSLELYTKALDKDPDFALAHVAAGDTYIYLNGQGKISSREMIPKVKEHITKAMAIDSSLADAYNVSAELKYQYEFDWSGAERDFLKAIEIDPASSEIRVAYGWFLMMSARFDEAEIQLQKAQDIDPYSLTVREIRGFLIFQQRRYDESLRYWLQIKTDVPQYAAAYKMLAGVYEQKKMYPEAVDSILRLMALEGRPTESIEALQKVFEESGWLGFRRQSLAIMIEGSKTEYIEPYMFASIYASIGDKEKAFHWLGKSIDERDLKILFVRIAPEFDILRDDPRYMEILQRINLKP